MKESYREELASRSGLEPYAGDGDVAGVASVRGNAGQPLSSDIRIFACRFCADRKKATPMGPRFGEVSTDAAESKNLCMRRHPKRENREILLVSTGRRIAAWRNGRKTSQAVSPT